MGGGVSAHSLKTLNAGDTFNYQNGEYGYLKYQVNDDLQSVTCLGFVNTGWGENPDDIIVPASVEYDDSVYTVTKIDHEEDNQLGGSTCTIPETVTEIANSALDGYSCNYYFLGSCPYDGDAGDISYLFNEDTYNTAIYVRESKLSTPNANGKTWQEHKSYYEDNYYMGMEVQTFNAPIIIELDRNKLELGANDSETLTATTKGDDGQTHRNFPSAQAAMTWSSSNTDVATVDNGTVTAVGEGTATITATNAIGAKATCEVTVGNGGSGGGTTDPGSGGSGGGTTDPDEGDKIDIGDCFVEGLAANAEIPLADVSQLKTQINVWYPQEMSTLELDKDFRVSFADSNKQDISEEPTSTGNYYLVVTGIGDYTGKAEIPFKVIQAAPKINIVEYEDMTWEGLESTDTTIPDQFVGTLTKPILILYCDYEFSSPLKEGTDYETYFEDADSKKVTEATAAGTYYFVVEGIGKYEGIKKFAFNVLDAAQVSGNWKYIVNSDNNTVTITGYADSFKPGEKTEETLPAEIDGKAVTGIGTGAFSGRMGTLHIPASVTSLAAGAFGDFWCNYVIFEGDCPDGTDVIKYTPGSGHTPGLYYADGKAGWTGDGAKEWATPYSPSSYDPNWVMKYNFDSTSKKAEWHIAGYKGQGGEVTIPATAFGSDKVTALDAGAIADASGITKLVVPANIATIADGAVKGLSADASVDFQGTAPTGTSYASEFQLTTGAAQGSKVKMTYLPENAASWKGSKWAQSGAYDVSEYDIYTCNPTDYIYQLNSDGSYTIIGYDGDANIIRLPSKLDGQEVRVFEGDYDANEVPQYVKKTIDSATVTAVGMRAFGSVKVNGEGSFAGKISIPSSIRTLGKQAFMQCQLSSIAFEEGSELEAIGSQCFWMSTLSTIEIPASVEKIGEGAFFDQYLTGISVEEGNKSFTSQDGVLFSKDMKALVAYPTDRPVAADKSYAVPDSVERLENYAFAMPPDAGSQADLKSITLNDGLKKIGDCVFQNLKWVTRIEIPDTVTDMGVAVFNSADELAEVKLPKGIKEIPEATFQFCHLLEKVEMPESLEKIGADAFLECNDRLREFSIPEGVTEIGENAFRLCYALEDVTFPKSLKIVGEGAFETTGLSAFDGAKTNIKHIGTGAFAHGRHLRKVTLPDTLTTMGSSVFSSCNALDNVVISEKMPLAEIPENTFFGCGSLESITIPANIQKVGARSFFSCGGLENVYFLNPGEWELGSRAFWQIDPANTQNEIPMPQVTAYGYSSSSTPSYVPNDIAKFVPLDITMVSPFETGMQTTVGKLVELNGLCQTGIGQLSYQWYLDRQKVNGATSLQFSFTPQDTGIHMVTLEVTSSIDPSNPATYVTFITVNPATSGGTGGGSSSGGGSAGGGSSSGGSGSGGGAVTPTPTPGEDASDTTTEIATASVSGVPTTAAYTGRSIKPRVSVAFGGKQLEDGLDYTVSYKNNVLPGTATVIIEGFGEFSGRIEKTFTITKAKQELDVKTKARSVSKAKLKVKKRSVTCITKVSSAKGTVSFEKLNGKGAIKINAKTGKVTIAKGTKKGTYKAQVEVSAAATSIYEAASKIVTVSVRVK